MPASFDTSSIVGELAQRETTDWSRKLVVGGDDNKFVRSFQVRAIDSQTGMEEPTVYQISDRLFRSPDGEVDATVDPNEIPHSVTVIPIVVTKGASGAQSVSIMGIHVNTPGCVGRTASKGDASSVRVIGLPAGLVSAEDRGAKGSFRLACAERTVRKETGLSTGPLLELRSSKVIDPNTVKDSGLTNATNSTVVHVWHRDEGFDMRSLSQKLDPSEQAKDLDRIEVPLESLESFTRSAQSNNRLMVDTLFKWVSLLYTVSSIGYDIGARERGHETSFTAGELAANHNQAFLECLDRLANHEEVSLAEIHED